MSSVLRIALCGLGLGAVSACGGPAPTAIRAPDRIDLDDTALTRIDAVAVDEAGASIDEVVVYISAVSDPAVLRAGHNNEVQCKRWGHATVTLEAPPVRADVLVSCRVVQELRVAPRRLMTVLESDAAGQPTPRELGAFQFQAIGLDGKAIKDAPIEITASTEGVLEPGGEGRLRAVKPGRATIHGVIADQSASLEVEVGLAITTRKGVIVAPSAHLAIAVEAGRYRVALGADRAVRVGAKGGVCEPHEAASSVETVCSFESAGDVRVENPASRREADAAASVTLRVVQAP